MFPPVPQSSGGMQKLTKVVKKLSAEDQDAVMAFAEFLLQRSASAPQQPPEIQLPKEIERADGESVVAGMQRLTKTYFMIEKDELLHQATDLMTSHLLKGRPAKDVIDDLEQLFSDKYESYRQQFNQD